MVARLQDFIESPRSRKSRKTDPPSLIILADAPGSDLVKSISIRSFSRIPANTNLILLFQDSEQANASPPIDGHTWRKVNALIKSINNQFDETVLKGISPELNRMVWITSRQRDFVDDESLSNDLLYVLKEPFKIAIHRLYDTMNISLAPQFSSVGSTISTTYFTQAQRYEDVIKASMLSAASVIEYEVETKPKYPPNISKETSGKTRWEDLRDQAESRLESGDNKHALAMFQECLRMDIPYSTAIWEIKSGLAFARMMLGQYVQAERDLHQLRDDLSGFDDQYLKPSITNAHGAILLNHSLALFRTGNYEEMKYCLNEIILPHENMPPSSIQPKEQLKHYKLSASVCRLRALVIAHQGFLHAPRIKEELNAADKWCKKLDNLKSETPIEVDSMHDWCEKLMYIQSIDGIRISNILNKARIDVLRGCYHEALSILQPALSDAIVKIGETNLLTIELALLSSFLQVETGQVHHGRVSCERCAEVIEEAFGTGHPLALEAEFILISAAQREGFLTLALDDSTSLCRRAESTADLGRSHPSTLKYKSQLGALNIECGNYSTAKAILTEVSENGVRLWGSDHPEVLRVRSQLSLAEYHLGALDTAETETFAVLYCQLRKYLHFQRDKLWYQGCSNYDARSFLRETPLLQGIGDAFAASGSEAAAHPDILYTLFTCGKIMTRQPISDLDLALWILGLVRDAAEKSLGRFHPLSLMACLFIGEIHSARGMGKVDDIERRDLYTKAISCFTTVTGDEALSSGCTNTGSEEKVDQSYLPVPLDSEHPIILHARQESILPKLLVSEFENDTTQDVDYRSELNMILDAQQSRPGRSHRQTVKTLMTILTLELCFEKPSIETLTGLISEIIEKTDAEDQRFLECLLLRERLAGVLATRQDLFKKEYGDLMVYIEKQIKEAEGVEDESMRKSVGRVKDRISLMSNSHD
ncbi:Nephrocystin-3 [Fusarium globosum]|uniref:Nephrocystin-3 n=1 Tax=Fusarium globosum TaxID=78864 RepID=A0A8H5YP40_9HYPO|nr:Nephrocystin-3 [Fusarium globosum]